MLKITICFLFLSVTFILFSSALLLAQPGLPGEPSQAPIDGGLIVLAIGGGAYAVKKLRDRI